MSVPHRNDTTTVFPRCPNEHYEFIVQPTGRDETGFAIRAPVIRYRDAAPCEHALCIGEIKIAVFERALPFRLVHVSFI
jgi:hypothetical protein